MAFESLMRIARSGKLLGPCEAYSKDGYIVCGDREFLDNALDPLDSGLLLVEEFARLELSDDASLVDWVRRRGPFDFDGERIGHNARKIKEPNLIPIERPDKPVEFGPRPYGPYEPHDMMVARRSVAWLRERGWEFDSIDQVRVHQEQIRNWMPALVDWVGMPDSWAIGAYLPDLVSDALTFFVSDIPRENPKDPPVGSGYTVEVDWLSVLQPMYLQIFSAFRRAERGLPAAAKCRDCGQPFLILDGRRATYCNSKCRNRFNVRAFRARAHGAAEAGTSSQSVRPARLSSAR
jgi:hypothetical protein